MINNDKNNTLPKELPCIIKSRNYEQIHNSLHRRADKEGS